MPTPIKFNTYGRDLLQGIHDFSSHTFKLLLSNTLPLAANAVKADITEISAGFGYSAGGPTVTMALSLVGATGKVVATDRSVVAAGGAIGPFRYGVLYNDTSTGDRLIGYIDIGSSITLADGDTYIFDFDGSAGLITHG